MFHFLSPKAEPKAEPKAPETVRIPRKKFDAIMGGAMDAMGDLTEFAKQAKARRDDSPIVQDDLLELLRKLIDAQKRIDAQMDADIAKSTDTSDTEWDKRSYNLLAMPTSQMAHSLQARSRLQTTEPRTLNCSTN